jgi:uncharacterized protein (TIGR02145 family)
MFLFLSCSSFERDNPFDCKGYNANCSSLGSSELQDEIQGNVFTDARDGEKYEFEVAPNGSIWMSENLNYSKDGTVGYCYEIGTVLGTVGANSSGCDSPYGRIYSYKMAMDGNSSQGVCPSGWHIPSVVEWQSIGANATSTSTKVMSSEFYVLAGNYDPAKGWKERGSDGFYWTSNGSNSFAYIGYYISGNSSTPLNFNTQTANVSGDYFSVRCVKDNDYMTCNGVQFSPAINGCSNGVIKPKCGKYLYDPANEFCYRNAVYPKCSGKEYNGETQFCSGGSIETRPCQYQPEWCNGYPSVGYVPTTVPKSGACFFVTDITRLCLNNGGSINGINVGQGNINCWGDRTLEQVGITERKDGGYYILVNGDYIGVIAIWEGIVGTYPVCTGNCDGANYEPETHFCFDNIELLKKCGGKTYNPNFHECISEELVCLSTLPSGYFCDVRDNNVYQQVVIGGKTWMAENLKIGLPDDLMYYSYHYTWAKAMDGKASSSANPSGVQGICPEGWHIPSRAEWQSFTPLVNYWTTTETGTYAYVNDIDYAAKTASYPVRCVRD